MNQPVQPVLTVRSARWEGNFAPGRDVVVGSDVGADLRVAHALAARAHLLLPARGCSTWGCSSRRR